MVQRAMRVFVASRAAPTLTWLALVSAWTAMAGQEGGRAEYVGGTVASLRTRLSGRILTTDDRVMVFQADRVRLEVPYERINMLEYGQQVSRRYALGVIVSPMLLLSKKRRHFLTVGFRDEQDRQQAMVFRVDKEDIRALLAALEARTGRRVEFQDEEARKAGRGGG
jgi:hypothetical protein